MSQLQHDFICRSVTCGYWVRAALYLRSQLCLSQPWRPASSDSSPLPEPLSATSAFQSYKSDLAKTAMTPSKPVSLSSSPLSSLARARKAAASPKTATLAPAPTLTSSGYAQQDADGGLGAAMRIGFGLKGIQCRSPEALKLLVIACTTMLPVFEKECPLAAVYLLEAAMAHKVLVHVPTATLYKSLTDFILFDDGTGLARAKRALVWAVFVALSRSKPNLFDGPLVTDATANTAANLLDIPSLIDARVGTVADVDRFAMLSAVAKTILLKATPESLSAVATLQLVTLALGEEFCESLHAPRATIEAANGSSHPAYSTPSTTTASPDWAAVFFSNSHFQQAVFSGMLRPLLNNLWGQTNFKDTGNSPTDSDTTLKLKTRAFRIQTTNRLLSMLAKRRDQQPLLPLLGCLAVCLRFRPNGGSTIKVLRRIELGISKARGQHYSQMERNELLVTCRTAAIQRICGSKSVTHTAWGNCQSIVKSGYTGPNASGNSLRKALWCAAITSPNARLRSIGLKRFMTATQRVHPSTLPPANSVLPTADSSETDLKSVPTVDRLDSEELALRAVFGDHSVALVLSRMFEVGERRNDTLHKELLKRLGQDGMPPSLSWLLFLLNSLRPQGILNRPIVRAYCSAAGPKTDIALPLPVDSMAWRLALGCMQSAVDAGMRSLSIAGFAYDTLSLMAIGGDGSVPQSDIEWLVNLIRPVVGQPEMAAAAKAELLESATFALEVATETAGAEKVLSAVKSVSTFLGDTPVVAKANQSVQ